jgi:hypothetical protein
MIAQAFCFNLTGISLKQSDARQRTGISLLRCIKKGHQYAVT